MKEDIVSFVDSPPEEYPFIIEMTGISYCDGSYRISRKNSTIYVFEYILEGQGTVVTDLQEFTAEKGDVYILHSQSSHVYYSDRNNPWTKIWVNAKGPLIDSLVHTYKLNSINHIRGTDVSQLFFKLYNTARSSEKSRREIFYETSLIFHEIIIALHKQLQNINPSGSPEAVLLREYLDKNVMGNVNLKELSELIYRSPSQVIRVFKNEYDITPYNYIMNRKIEIAKLLLLNTNRSIKEISVSLGFCDEHYFSNFFKSRAGVSPLGFRKLNAG